MNIENQKKVIGILVLLLVVSIVGNIFLYQKVQKNESPYGVQNTGTSTVMTFEGPGFKSEVVTFFDGKQYRTYATSSPLSDSDIRTMREEMEKEFDRMNEFFRRQNELFRLLWGF